MNDSREILTRCVLVQLTLKPSPSGLSRARRWFSAVIYSISSIMCFFLSFHFLAVSCRSQTGEVIKYRCVLSLARDIDLDRRHELKASVRRAFGDYCVHNQVLFLFFCGFCSSESTETPK